MSEDNGFKLVARYKKAKAIADKLAALEVPVISFEAENTVAVRTLAAQLAGTHVPSETTWALVVELIKEKRSAHVIPLVPLARV